MINCSEIYLKGSQEGEWAEANAIHSFTDIDNSDEFFKIPCCSNCKAKKMLGVNYTEVNHFEDKTPW